MPDTDGTSRWWKLLVGNDLGEEDKTGALNDIGADEHYFSISDSLSKVLEPNLKVADPSTVNSGNYKRKIAIGVDVPDYVQALIYQRTPTEVEIADSSLIEAVTVPVGGLVGTPGEPLQASDVIMCAWTYFGTGGAHQPYTRWNTGSSGAWPNYTTSNFIRGKIILGSSNYSLNRPLLLPSGLELHGKGMNSAFGTTLTVDNTDGAFTTASYVLAHMGSNGPSGDFNGNFWTNVRNLRIETEGACNAIRACGAQCSTWKRIDIGGIVENQIGVFVAEGRPVLLESVEVRGEGTGSDPIETDSKGFKWASRARGTMLNCSTNRVDIGVLAENTSCISGMGNVFENCGSRIAVKESGSQGFFHFIGTYIKEFLNANAAGDGDGFAFESYNQFYFSGVFRSENAMTPNWKHGGTSQGDAMYSAGGNNETPFLVESLPSWRKQIEESLPTIGAGYTKDFATDGNADGWTNETLDGTATAYSSGAMQIPATNVLQVVDLSSYGIDPGDLVTITITENGNNGVNAELSGNGASSFTSLGGVTNTAFDAVIPGGAGPAVLGIRRGSARLITAVTVQKRNL